MSITSYIAKSFPSAYRRGVKNWALNAGASSVGMALPFAVKDHIYENDGKSFLSRLKDESLSMLKFTALMGFLTREHTGKAFKNMHTPDYFKSLSLFKGKNPLIELKKNRLARYKWPAIGAAAGAYVNYDPENPVSSSLKGAAGGGLLMSPKMFKSHRNTGVAHSFVDELVDSPGYLMFAPAAVAVANKYKKHKLEQERAKREERIRKIREFYRRNRSSIRAGASVAGGYANQYQSNRPKGSPWQM